MVSDKFLDSYLDPDWVTSVRNEIDGPGIYCLEGFFRPGALETLQSQVLELEKKATPSEMSGNRKYSVKGEMMKGTLIDDFCRSGILLRFANAILHPGAGNRNVLSTPVRQEEIHCGLNIMRGPGDVTKFHFDGTALNMLVPIFIPQLKGVNRGQLKIYPNIRSFRGTFADKVLIPAIAHAKVLRPVLSYREREIDYKLGDAYLFYGYRSLHGVESPSASGLRCVTNIGIAGRPSF